MSNSQIVTLQQIDSLTFQHPVSFILSGTTGSGKSSFVANLIEQNAIEGNIENIYYFVPQIENLNIIAPPGMTLECKEGIPSNKWCQDTLNTSKRNSLVIIDDQWSKVINSVTVEYLTSVGKNHWGVSVIMIAHNYFNRGTFAGLIK
jgi:hypothetical protein